MNIIKEFLNFRKSFLLFKTIELTQKDKSKLTSFDSDIIERLYGLTLDKLSREILREDLNKEFVQGAKFSLYFFKSFFKDYERK